MSLGHRTANRLHKELAKVTGGGKGSKLQLRGTQVAQVARMQIAEERVNGRKAPARKEEKGSKG